MKHFDYKLVTRCAINFVVTLGETKQGCHLSFMKLFAKNAIIYPFGHVLAFMEAKESEFYNCLNNL